MSEFNDFVEQPVEEQVENTDVKNEKSEQDVMENSNIKDNATSISLNGSTGKFKDTESLLNAYNNLQAEFTRKCQKLSELENSLTCQENVAPNVDDYINNNPQFVKEILERYLTDIKNHSTPATISNAVGSGIPLTPPPTPTTMEEAREVVKNIFR